MSEIFFNIYYVFQVDKDRRLQIDQKLGFPLIFLLLFGERICKYDNPIYISKVLRQVITMDEPLPMSYLAKDKLIRDILLRNFRKVLQDQFAKFGPHLANEYITVSNS